MAISSLPLVSKSDPSAIAQRGPGRGRLQFLAQHCRRDTHPASRKQEDSPWGRGQGLHSLYHGHLSPQASAGSEGPCSSWRTLGPCTGPSNTFVVGTLSSCPLASRGCASISSLIYRVVRSGLGQRQGHLFQEGMGTAQPQERGRPPPCLLSGMSHRWGHPGCSLSSISLPLGLQDDSTDQKKARTLKLTIGDIEDV